MENRRNWEEREGSFGFQNREDGIYLSICFLEESAMNIHELNAYEILEERWIEDVKSTGVILRHKKSGARVALLSNQDDNKVFYIGFRTAPEDETGVPHIIEHTVLCGSEKFPLKDPFVELVKGSLNTFLNAMTYPDKTVYPIASCNDRDFQNLMDVYLDAVFHPNITKYEEIFKQEGWHYELESEDAPITINGVVYNEMKGAYSSPEEVLQNQIFKSLFPDNTYSQDSGGNPLHIPELTYERYLEFYHRLYHPSNAYIYLYGDMDMAEKLDWMDREYLSHYDYLEVHSEIPKQEPFSKTVERCETYSIASDDSEENATYLAYNRVIEDSLNREYYQAFDVLDYALVSAPGAPLRQALIDAGIGEDVYGGYDSGYCQPVFSVIAKNANGEDRERFEEIIEETLEKLVREGINKESLLAGINSSEFRFREADFGQFPKGLLYGLNCLDSWLFDDMAPFIHLECLDTFAFLKEQVQTDYFEKLIERYLLKNTHGSMVVVSPQRGKNDGEEEELARRLEAYKNSLSPEEIRKLIADTKHLKEYQEEPTSEEDLRKLPMLSREDIRKEIIPLSNEELTLNDMKVLLHDIDTNGIDYVNLLFDAEDIPMEDVGYLGMLGTILGYVDTEHYSYGDLSNAINIYTGGISSSANLFPNSVDREKLGVKYEVRIKVLAENLEQALMLTDEILMTSKLDNVKRLGELVAQTKARLQVMLSNSGNSVATMRGLSHMSKYGKYQDELRGVAFYRSVCEMERLLKEDPKAVTDKLKRICARLFARRRMMISFTARKENYNEARTMLEAHLGKLPEGTVVGERTQVSFVRENEGFTDASQIQYVVRCGNFVNHGFSYTGVLRILKVILSYDYLWINVRVKGGAYGCSGNFLRNGETSFSSYRDPNLEKTNEVYEGIPQYLREFYPDERDMTKYIIGTFGVMDTPMYPEAKGTRSLAAYLGGLTEEMLQRERDEVLGATAEDVRALADLVESVLRENVLCVIGNEKAIQNAAGLFDRIEKLCS